MTVQIGDFGNPDDSREIPGGRIETVVSPAGAISRGTLQPGWVWSNDIRPIAVIDLCQVEHFDYVVSGRLGIRLEDGTEYTAGPGETSYIPLGTTAGHRRRAAGGHHMG